MLVGFSSVVHWIFIDLHWCSLMFIRFSLIVIDVHQMFIDFHRIVIGCSLDCHSIVIDVYRCSSMFIGFCIDFQQMFLIVDRIAGFLFRKSSYGATWSQEGYKIDEIIKTIQKRNVVFLDLLGGSPRTGGKNHRFVYVLCVNKIEKKNKVFTYFLERAPA